jgi:hypothetical protein
MKNRVILLLLLIGSAISNYVDAFLGPNRWGRSGIYLGLGSPYWGYYPYRYSYMPYGYPYRFGYSRFIYPGYSYYSSYPRYYMRYY